MGIKINDYLTKVTEQDKVNLELILEGIKCFAPNKNKFVAAHDAFHLLLMEKIREEHLKSGSTNIKQ